MSYSVALCTYNGEKYLSEQLDSIIHQTMPPSQIVICDDYSIDCTCKIVYSYIYKYPNINWKFIENKMNKHEFEQMNYNVDE